MVSLIPNRIPNRIPVDPRGAVIGALNQLAADVDSLSEFQMRQFDQKDSRGEALLMQRLRAFVAEGAVGKNGFAGNETWLGNPGTKWRFSWESHL